MNNTEIKRIFRVPELPKTDGMHVVPRVNYINIIVLRSAGCDRKTFRGQWITRGCVRVKIGLGLPRSLLDELYNPCCLAGIGRNGQRVKLKKISQTQTD